MDTSKTVNVVTDFSRFPAGRFKTDGDYSGEAFRDDILLNALRSSAHVTVELDGTAGYGSSFLDEAFGGLVRKHKFTASDLHERLTIVSSDESLVNEVWEYINSSKTEA